MFCEKKINVWILYKIWSFRTIAEFLLTAYKRVNLTVHSVNLQKRWTLFEECWHVCVKACRILMHLENFSSLILPKWFEISKYYKNSIQNFTVDMNLFIPCYPTRKGIDFHLIPQSVEWIKFVENHLCSVQARFSRKKFVSGYHWFKNFICAILILDMESLDCLSKHLEFWTDYIYLHVLFTYWRHSSISYQKEHTAKYSLIS